MEEIRFHGRGGQGIAVASEILALAFAAEGKNVAAFPMFGSERRGAPLTAFMRVDDAPVRIRTQVYSPKCIVIADPLFKDMPEVYEGLQAAGIVVVNACNTYSRRPHSNVECVGLIDASRIAWERLGVPITNTCMLGAFVATTGWLRLESILVSLENYFNGELLEKNKQCVKIAFDATRVMRFTEE